MQRVQVFIPTRIAEVQDQKLEVLGTTSPGIAPRQVATSRDNTAA